MHPLLAQQLRRTAPDGTAGKVDLPALLRLIEAAYAEADRERRLTDRSITLMAEELTELNRRVEAKAEARVSRTEARFHDAIESMSDGFAIFDGEWRLVAWNAAFARMFAFPGLPMATGLDFAAACREAGVANAIGTGTAVEVRTADGRITQALHRRTAEGGYVSVYRDVTALLETQRALAQAERDHASLFDHAEIGIFRVAPNGRLLRANPALVRLNGYAEESEMLAAMGDAPTWYVDPERQAELRSRLEHDGHVIDFESEVYRHRTRERIWITETAWVVREENARIRYFEGTVKNITERKHADRALRLAKEAAEAASRAKSDFLANMSHELRTPLNAILGFAEVIRDQLFGPDAGQRYADYAAHVHASGSHLLALINDILDMAKIESGHLELEAEPLAPLEVLAGCLVLLEPRAAAGGIALSGASPKALPRLHADAKRFRQILLNVLSNAIKFTPSGGRVSAHARLATDGGLELRIVDTGIGIAPAELRRVFEPFRQGDASRARRFEGTGLGLAITRRLIEQHGGRIEIASAPGAGTEVTLWFPASRLSPVDASRAA